MIKKARMRAVQLRPKRRRPLQKAGTSSPRKASIAARDKAALELAIETMRNEGSESANAIEDHLAHGSWWDAATTASYHCQIESLHLKPWQSPPCFAHLDDAEPAAKALLHKMLVAKISRYHPDPLAALKAASKSA